VEIISWKIDCCFAHYLRKAGRTQSRLREFHRGIVYCFVLCDECTDSCSACAVSLANGIHQHYMLIHYIEMKRADVFAIITKFTISFIAEEIKIVAKADILQRFHFLSTIQVSGWIIRAADDDCFCLWSDHLLEIRNGRESETIVYRRSDGHYFYSCSTRKAI